MSVNKTENLTRRARCYDDGEEHSNCAICLDIMLLTTSSSAPLSPFLLPCGHKFHAMCVERIRLSPSLSQCCPLCRSALPPPPPSAEDYYHRGNKIYCALQRMGIIPHTFRVYTSDENKSIRLMIDCWYRAACLGDQAAMFNLGLMFRLGFGLSQSDEQSCYWYLKSALKGHVPAQSNMGYLYHHGIGIERNLSEAVKWYSLAADDEYPDALYNLGALYEHGEGVTQDLLEAVWLYNKAKEYEHHSAKQALLRLGLV